MKTWMTMLLAASMLAGAAVSASAADVQVLVTKLGTDGAEMVFEPALARVAVGDTVTWRFEGKSAHNVTAKDGDFESDLTKEGTFEHTFDEAGSFDYVCTVHPGMGGTVKVSEGGAGGAP